MKNNLLFIMIILSLLVGCSDSSPVAPKPTPTSVQQLNKKITNVIATNESMTSVHVRHTGYEEEITAFAFATDILHIVQGARQHNLLPNSEKIRFLVYVPFNDKYGNPSLQPVLGFIFRVEDLKKINFSKGVFTEFNLLDLSAETWRREDLRYSQNTIQAFCSKYRAHSHRFCGRESF